MAKKTTKLTPAQQRVWNQIKHAMLNQEPGGQGQSAYDFVLDKWLELYATMGSGIRTATLRGIERAGYIRFTEDASVVKQPRFKLTQQGMDELAPVEKLDASYDAWADGVASQLPAQLAGEAVPQPEDTPRFGIGGGNPDMPEDMPESGNLVFHPEHGRGVVRVYFSENAHVRFSTSEYTVPVSSLQHSTNAEIAVLVDCLRKYAAAAAQIAEQQQALKSRLAELLTERGNAWTDAAGYARLTSSATRISYDTDELDALLITEPDRYQWLRDLRKVTPVEPYVQVR